MQFPVLQNQSIETAAVAGATETVFSPPVAMANANAVTAGCVVARLEGSEPTEAFTTVLVTLQESDDGSNWTDNAFAGITLTQPGSAIGSVVDEVSARLIRAKVLLTNGDTVADKVPAKTCLSIILSMSVQSPP